MIMIPLSLTLSLMSLMLNHPLSFTLMIMSQTLLTTMILTMTHQSSWFGYILFLVFIGALLVLFVYIATLASNEMFSMNPFVALSSMVALLMLTLTTIMFHSTTASKTIHPLNPEIILNTMINKFYSQNLLLTLILIIYLLLALLIVAKISNIKQGPLRHSH